MNGSVIIFKGDDDGNNDSNDPYVEELSKLFNPKLIPALKFEFNNLDLLKERLDSPDDFSGIILSSARCVQAVEKSGSLSKWKNHKVFTIGSKTASLARDLGVEPLGENCGNASSLAEFILREYSFVKLPLLLPHGSLSLKTLPNVLTKGGVNVETVEVYTTLQNPRLEEHISQFFQNSSKVDFIVFMSPSAIEYCLPYLEKFQHLSTIKFIALGRTTGSALEARSITPTGVADKPTPQHVLAVMSKCINIQNQS